jgi:hypothetical protein
MRRQIIILEAMIVLVAVSVSAQIRRPPVVEVCPDLDSIWCQLWPHTCEECTTEEGQVTQVAPRRAPYDPWLGDYSLPKTVGVTQIAHEFVNPPVIQHFTNLDLAYELRDHGIKSMKVWIDNHPFDGDTQAFCYDFNGNDWCEYDMLGWDCGGYYLGESHPRFENMIRFWQEAPVEIIFARFQRYGYREGRCMAKTFPPYYAITKRLYEIAGDRDMTVVFADWEEDWWPWGCHTDEEYDYPFQYWWGQDELDRCLAERTRTECGVEVVEQRYAYLMQEIERRQSEVAQARREAYINLGHRPNLRVMTSAIVNKYPLNHNPPAGAESVRLLAERITDLPITSRPDLLLLSYWLKGYDPGLTINWLTEVTGYPPQRIVIDELGGIEGVDQASRIADYVPAFWGLGVRTVNVWLWRQTWHDPGKNRGLWKQITTEGRVEWGDPTDGYYVLRDLNEGR